MKEKGDMIPLSYNTNGLKNLSLRKAIEEVVKAGYEGVEISLYPSHLHPFETSPKEIQEIKNILNDNSIPAVCIATGWHKLLSEVPFEPSLISKDKKARRKRIDLIRSTIDIARTLSVPVVNFASGFLRKEVSSEKAWDYLIEGIEICLSELEDIILAIEPEPGMFIETTTKALSLIKEIDSSNLMLNLDIGHVYCCEENLIDSILKSISYTRHIHIEDIKGKVHHHEMPGTGDIEFQSIFQVLKDFGYKYYLSVELYHHDDVWQQALHQSRNYLLKIQGEKNANCHY